MIGSMPNTDPQAACAQVTRYLKDIPAWPQLPKRSFLENMYAQFSQGFPGGVVTENSILIDRSQDLNKPLEQLYAAYLDNDIDKYAISREYAAGLHAFLALTDLSPQAVKGQLTGPITWGLSVSDDSRRPILYDDVLGDAVPRFLKLKAAWQERQLGQVAHRTIIFLDEPYMASYGSSAASTLSAQTVIDALNEVFSGLSGLKGVHCCANTDWSVLLRTNADIISFDTYGYAASLALFPNEVGAFLQRPGAVAWGIVPTDAAALAGESVASLKDRLEEAIAPFTRHGIPFRELINRAMLTPACGLAGLTEGEASRALELLAGLSREMRRRYC